MMISEKYMCPFYDTSFKRIFGQPENKMLLIDFLNNLLVGEQHIKDVTYLDKEQIPGSEDAGVIVYDIYCETDTGEYFIVEMQNWAQGYFIPRTLFYAASAIVKQRTKLEKDPNGKRGYNHYEIKAVYTIAFLNYTDKSLDERPRVDAAICDMKTAQPITHLMRFVYLQLPLFTKKQDECDTFFERWIYVLKNMNVLDKLPDAYQCEAFNKLKQVADISAMTAEEFADYEWSRRHYYDWETTKYFMEKEKEEAEKVKEEAKLAKEEAKLAKEETKLAKEKAKKAEDQAKKKEEEKLQMVRNFKSLNVSMDVIKQATGLTEEEINAL
jgi:predicted transposase/invertase (TIGR01784 family)